MINRKHSLRKRSLYQTRACVIENENKLITKFYFRLRSACKSSVIFFKLILFPLLPSPTKRAKHGDPNGIFRSPPKPHLSPRPSRIFFLTGRRVGWHWRRNVRYYYYRAHISRHALTMNTRLGTLGHWQGQNGGQGYLCCARIIIIVINSYYDKLSFVYLLHT